MRIKTSKHCILHSFLPNRALTQSLIAPVLALPLTPSTAPLIASCAVFAAACAKTPALSSNGVVSLSANPAVSGSGGSNHGVWKSNNATTSMNSSNEQ